MFMLWQFARDFVQQITTEHVIVAIGWAQDSHSLGINVSNYNIPKGTNSVIIN